jgi:Protein kinase domain
MGEVYLALDTVLERRVALKVLPRAVAQDLDARARMMREARAASALRHPAIVTVYGFGDAAEQSYIAMELVEGETFSALIARRGPLPVEEAAALVAEVGEALEVAHRAGILHRDVKSANLMLDGAGQVKILDFGLSKRLVGESATPTPARTTPGRRPPSTDDPDATTVADGAPALTATGTRMGTPAYSAPELWEGRRVDRRCDVFSLGVVLHELLAGERPFRGATVDDVRRAIDLGDVPSSGHPALDPVIRRAVAADPTARFASVATMIAALRRALHPRPLPFAGVLGGMALIGVSIATAAWLARSSLEIAPIVVARPEVPLRPRDLAPRALTAMGGCARNATFVQRGYVVFDQQRGTGSDLYRVSFSGGPILRLTSGPTKKWRAAAGVESSHVVFVEDYRRLRWIDAFSGNTVRTADVPAEAVGVTPDGYIYLRGSGQEIRRVTDAGEEVLVNLPDPLDASMLGVSPDGARIAFTPSWVRSLCLVTVATRKLDCVPRPGILASRPAFSPDGGAVYYGARSGIRRYEIASGRDELVVPGAEASSSVAVSPDEAWLVYGDCQPRGALRNVSYEPPLTTLDEPHLTDPVTGPDGRLAWISRSGDDVLRASDATGKVHELVDGRLGAIGSPAFDATGAWLAFAGSGERAGIHLVSTRGDQPARRLTDGLDQFPLFTNQGTLLFSRNDAEGIPRLHEVEPTTGVVSLASADDRIAYAVDRATGELLVLPTQQTAARWWNRQTGTHRPAPHLSAAGENATHFAFSPSGRFLVLAVASRGIYRRDLHLPDPPAELATTLAEDQALAGLAVDDEGDVLVQAVTWSGELYGITLPPRPTP